MRVASLVHFYVPYRRAGSETMLHTVNLALKEAGHEVMAAATALPDSPRAFEFEGVPVVSSNWFVCQEAVRRFKPDVILTHHDNTVKAISLARKTGCKSAFMVHNSFDLNKRLLACKPDLTIFNSHWVQAALGYRGVSTVFHPPVWAEEHRTDRGNKITLVNLNENKGSQTFYSLAERNPDLEFLAVVGGHGEQIIRTDLPNVEVQEQTSDMKKDVWSKTAVLLMPSVYESYGMAGVEALASGIPVLAHPTPGLRESLWTAGVFIDRANVQGYETTVRKLLSDQEYYKGASNNSFQRSEELNPEPELKRLVRELEMLGGH